MKKIQLVMVTAGMIGMSATAVNAQSSFEGAYGQLGIGYQGVTPSVSDVRVSLPSLGINNAPLTSSVGSSSNFTGVVTAGYNFSVTKEFLLGLGVEYSPLASSTSNITANYGPDANDTFYRATSDFKIENAYNIFLSPGIAIDKDKLAYAKIGYTGANANGAGQSISLSGYSLGLGYKQIIKGGWYGFGEVNYASYGNKSVTSSYNSTVIGIGSVPTTATSTISANTMNVLVGVGYKF
jgi:hypothetical protein